MAAAANPRLARSSATLAAVRFVRLKMMVSPRSLRLEHPGEHLDLVHGVRAVDELLDGLDGVRVLLVVAHRADVRRLVHVPAGQGDDGARHRGREQHRLAAGGRHREDLLDVGQEAEVEHLVGLVEDDDARVAEVEVSLLGQVDEPAGGADDDLDAHGAGPRSAARRRGRRRR